ncbi:MAG: HD domain-containing protein [Coriobacteriia bacterium]|nr:HD domain-containing protein [Coriobacteriia bacterium]
MRDFQAFISAAFLSPEWRGALEAWYEALGVSVLVIDPEADLVVSSGPRAGYCDVAAEGDSARERFRCLCEGPGGCLGGTPYRLLPLVHEDRLVARLLVCGFVTSAAERRALGERLVSRGLTRDAMRAILRGVPVIARRRIAAIEEMVLHQARSLFENVSLSERAEEDATLLGTLSSLLSDDALLSGGPGSVPSWALSHALTLLGGSRGCLALLCPESGRLRVVAEEGDPCPAVLDGLRRASESGRSAVASSPSSRGPAGGLTLYVPLTAEAGRIGALSVDVPADGGGVRSLEALERFAAFATVALDVALGRERREREIVELMHVNEVARLLSRGCPEAREIAPLAASLLEKALEFSAGGVLLTHDGSRRTVLVVRGQVARAEVDALLAEVGGPGAPSPAVEIVSHLGEVVDRPVGPREWTTLSSPLVADGAVAGRLFAARYAPDGFDEDDRRLLERLAAQVAAAFDRSARVQSIAKDYAHTLELLSAALDSGEGMEPGHAGEVMGFALLIGEEMELPADDLELLRLAGLVHDVGKIGVSEAILLKPTRLSEEEMAEVRRHCRIGASLIEQVEYLNAVAPVVLHHHERWDGRGYPMGLAGPQIPLLARILAVADAYASMCADTPYRGALPPAVAEAELAAASGTQFDPLVVEAFTSALRRVEGAGLTGLFRQVGSEPGLPA